MTEVIDVIEGRSADGHCDHGDCREPAVIRISGGYCHSCNSQVRLCAGHARQAAHEILVATRPAEDVKPTQVERAKPPKWLATYGGTMLVKLCDDNYYRCMACLSTGRPGRVYDFPNAPFVVTVRRKQSQDHRVRLYQWEVLSRHSTNYAFELPDDVVALIEKHPNLRNDAELNFRIQACSPYGVQ
jgi:hypothetical protein